MEANNNSSQQNPLLAPQRERAGANTFAKFEYQYHWALCRILTEHEQSTNYVLFIELHEDVVVCNSTDQNVAQFEFNQIKNLTCRPLRAKDLTNRKGVGKNKKNSTLGKMLLGVNGKPFLEKIKKLNLVATCGFDLHLKNEGVKLSIITKGEVHADCLNEIQEKINLELGSCLLPDNLTFIEPELPSQGFQDATIGRVSILINKIKPHIHHNPQSIYRLLIDELHRKGSVVFDYTQWNNLVKYKGITFEDVEGAISQHVERRDLEKINTDLNSIASELALKHHEKIQLRQNVERYHNEACLMRSLKGLSNQKAIKNCVSNNILIFMEQGVSSFIAAAISEVSLNDRANFTDEQHLTAGILYELISSNYGQEIFN